MTIKDNQMQIKLNKGEIAVFGIVVASFIIGIYFYPQMPERMASHWNEQGQVNGYMSRFWGVFLMPFISLGLALLFILIPRIDPLKANIQAFKKQYYLFIALVLLFLLYIYLLTIFWNLGARFNMTRVIAPAIGILFFYCGVLIEKAKRNWFIGIRTPWTLSSDRVWEKTHRLGGKLFKAAGIIAILGVFFPDYAFFLILVPVIVAALFAVVYSYFEFQREKRA
jgi:uncharacterized membrane protein